jgi:hypothetical protein
MSRSSTTSPRKYSRITPAPVLPSTTTENPLLKSQHAETLQTLQNVNNELELLRAENIQLKQIFKQKVKKQTCINKYISVLEHDIDQFFHYKLALLHTCVVILE